MMKKKRESGIEEKEKRGVGEGGELEVNKLGGMEGEKETQKR